MTEENSITAADSTSPDDQDAAAEHQAGTPTAAVEGTPTAEEKPKRGRPRAKKSAGFELVLTVKGSEDGTDWQADVTQGGKKVVNGLGISAAAVSAAAKDLHPEIAEAIDSVLAEARDRHRARVEQLQAELEAAQKALADLSD